MQFSGILQVTAMGHSWGSVLLWNNNLVIINQVRNSNQELYAMVQENPNKKSRMLSVVYACTNIVTRNMLWNNLKEISDSYISPWLLGEILMKSPIKTINRGREGWPYNISRANKFVDCNYCSLLDLGFNRSRYTWSNHRHRNGLILHRLDCYLANKEWLLSYENVDVTYLFRTLSDHSPIFLTLNSNHVGSRRKLFHLETY